MKIHIQGRTDLKKKLIYLVLVIFIFTLGACNKKVDKVEEKPVVIETVEKEMSLNIITTNKLLCNMVSDIIGERHSIGYMFTTQDKLWNFDYTEDSLNNISRKDLFFYWGSGLEPWASDFINKLAKTRVGAVNISRGVKFLEYDREVKYKEAVLKDNPYFWVNIDAFKIAMLNVKNAIQDKDTKNRDFYEKNFTKAINDVEEYQKKLKEAANKLKDYTFVVDGDELDYFTEYYGFKTLKLNNYRVIVTEKGLEENLKVEEKLKELKNVVFLYDVEDKLMSNEALISKYNLKSSNILVYKDDIKYIDILASNLKSLEELVPQQ
jgi:zinc/manganese transport system substrate-binding protein